MKPTTKYTGVCHEGVKTGTLWSADQRAIFGNLLPSEALA